MKLAAVALLLAAVCLLDAAGAVRLTAWSEIAARSPLWAVLLAYLATWLAARRLHGPARRAALGVGSLATACLFDPWFAAASVAWSYALWRVLFAGGRARPGAGLAFVLATFAALAVACNRDLFAVPAPLGRLGYLFAVAYVFRIAWLLHQVRLQRSVVPCSDVLLYFVFAPAFVIVPYMLAIPRLDRFRRGLDTHDRAHEASGIRLVAWSVALMLAAVALHLAYDPRRAFDAALRAHDPLGIALHALPAYPLHAALEGCALAALLVGLVRAMGFELGPSFDRPLLASSIGDYWRRWNTHFRDLLVELFYVPVILRLRRTPTRAIVMGCIAVFVVGSTLFHLPKHYFRYGSAMPPNLHILVENVLMGAIVAWALVREARDARRRVVRAPVTPARFALRLVRTWILVLVVVIFAGYGAQYAVFGEHRPVVTRPPGS